MEYHVLVVDFDGTIAEDGIVPPSTMQSLHRVRNTGRKIILVTGRRLEPLLNLLPDIQVFHRIVAENGAVLFMPETGEEKVLIEGLSPELVSRLRQRNVHEIEVGKVIVATWRPHESVALDVISEMGIDAQIIFNKDAVMLLPSGCNKALGLHAALASLQLSPINAVSIGDAENDFPMLRMAGASIAVQNAVEAVKGICSVVTRSPRGAGVEELCSQLIADDLQSLHLSPRFSIRLGTHDDGTPFHLPMRGESILITGGSGGGKSRFATELLEQLTAMGAQGCVVDPEGDYLGLDNSITLGSAERAPTVAEIMNVLEQPGQHCVVSFFAVEKKDRPEYFNRLLRGLAELRSRTARPHWIIVDEAHYAAPVHWQPAAEWSSHDLKSMMFITAFEDRLSRSLLLGADWVVFIADSPVEALQRFCQQVGCGVPDVAPLHSHSKDVALAWRRCEGRANWFQRSQSDLDHQRHRHSLYEGEMDEEHEFVFRGANGQFQLRAGNLKRFIELAEGLDEETWEYHLRNRDYSKWIGDVAKDADLAKEVAKIETNADLDRTISRLSVIDLIKQRYESRW